MLRVGLTGGIASGKSLVADAFARLGVPVVDADVLAREVVTPGSDGLAAVVDAFGSEVLAADGQLDRRQLRARIFADDAARARLEQILHPRIRAAMDAQLDAHAAAGADWALAVIPLLVETGQRDRFDRILVVDAPEAVQVARLQARDHASETEARAILERQADREQRLRHADDVIVNAGDDTADAALHERLAELDRNYRRLANAGARHY